MTDTKNIIILPSGMAVDIPPCHETVGIQAKDEESARYLLCMSFTTEDRKFLAELMIARWQEFGGIKEA